MRCVLRLNDTIDKDQSAFAGPETPNPQRLFGSFDAWASDMHVQIQRTGIVP